MSKTVGDFLIQRLLEWGVRRIYGYPGDGINDDLDLVTWEQRAMSGDPKFDASQVLPEFDYAGMAALCGLRGLRVRSPEAVGPSWDDALRAGGPVVLDVRVDPEVPPLPPHVSFEHAAAMLRSMLKGDLTVDIVQNIGRQVLAGTLSRRR